MRLTGNTIFITGGGSGIGRGLAEALHDLGNTVIISGRRKGHLDATIAANPGMIAVEIDVTDSQSINAVVQKLIHDYPKLNVVLNNAGVMQFDSAAGIIDETVLVSAITTNLLGPIRLTSALIEHLKAQPEATILYTTSWLGFVPFAPAAVYSATKAALHSYAMSQRFMLRGTSVRVQEIVPPWTRTDLLNSNDEPRAMPLATFIEQIVALLGSDAEELVVDAARQNRNNPGPFEHEFVTRFNEQLTGEPAPQ